ncbi:hypothetical protein BH23BAC1_BH23BAC1_27990 [soil metagenome]
MQTLAIPPVKQNRALKLLTYLFYPAGVVNI